MAWASVQLPSTPLEVIAGGSSTKTHAYGSNVVSGNLLVVYLFNTQDESLSTMSDTRGTSYVQCGNFGSGSLGHGYIYAGVAPGSGANTVTSVWLSAVGDTYGWLLEFSGNAATTPIDTQNTATATSATVLSGTAPATAVANELAVAFLACSKTATAGVPSGWTGFNASTFSFSLTSTLALYQVQSSSGATPQASWTQASSGLYIGFIVTFTPGVASVNATASMTGKSISDTFSGRQLNNARVSV